MHAGLLQKYNASNATYLFQPDKLNMEYDLGDKTIQCGRRADAFKLWLTWKVFTCSHSLGLAVNASFNCPKLLLLHTHACSVLRTYYVHF